MKFWLFVCALLWVAAELVQFVPAFVIETLLWAGVLSLVVFWVRYVIRTFRSF